MKTALILGAGPAGCAAAHQIRLNLPDWRVILIEKAPFIGAGARTNWYSGHPFTFGPRHFLTKNEAVWAYMQKYCPLRSCADHEFKTYVPDDGEFYNFPIHEDDIERMPDRMQIKNELRAGKRLFGYHMTPKSLEDYWIGGIGGTLYNKFVKPYTEKMWQMSASEIDTFKWSPKGAMIKSGPRAAWSNALSGYPLSPNGYNNWFDLCVEGCEVRLNQDINDYALGADVFINTVFLDTFHGFRFGPLPYIGRDFYKFVLPLEFALPEHVYFTYEGGTEPWTRLTEYKKFTGHRSPHTLLSIEIPSDKGRHYPIPTKAAQAKAKQYLDLFPKDVYTIGRHGTYRYEVDIAVCIEMAMALVERIKDGWDHPIPLESFR